jgi:hypothetical protein
MGIGCTNCKKDVASDAGRIYAEVFVCGDCFFIASRFEERILKELKALQLVAREAIRIGLVQHQLSFGKADPMKDLSKKEVLEQMLKMMEMRDAKRPAAQRSDSNQQPQPATQATRQVRQLGGRGGPRAQPGPLDLPGNHPPRDPVDGNGSAA